MFFMFILLIFLLKIINYKYINQINNNNSNFMNKLMLLIIISMSGIPPFFGFSGKFFIFISFFENNQLFFLITLVILNFNSLYFYIQNLRFTLKNINKSNQNYIYVNNVYKLNDFLINSLIILIIINSTNIFILSDLYIIIDNIIINLYI